MSVDPNLSNEGIEGEEYVPADDRIIGKAFWLSLLVVGSFAIPAGVISYFILRPKPAVVVTPEPVLPPTTGPAGRNIAAPAITFKDITEDAGISFVHENGARGEKLLPETMGGGVAFLDYDRDGDQDLLFVNSSRWPDDPRPAAEVPAGAALYQNNGRGLFTDVTASAGLAKRFYGMGVAVGDVDRDGWCDVFITGLGGGRLMRNSGDGTFEDVTAAAGVAGAPTDWSTSAAFFDMERDGDLDLFVCNYVKWSKEIDYQVNYTLTGVGRAYGPPTNFEGTFPILYRNDGAGVFQDVSAAAGVQVSDAELGRPVAKALGVAPADFNGDGFLDLIVANDTTRKFAFINQKDGTFIEAGKTMGIAFDREGAATGAMGIDVAHDRNSNDLSIVVGNFANQMSSLYTTQGKAMHFSDAAITDGIGPATRLSLTFGAFFFDADLDGRLDILHTNGHIETDINLVQSSQSYAQPGQLFWNAGDVGATTYVEVPRSMTGDLSKPIVGRGAAYADIDGDGDLDVALTQVGGRPMLLRNDQVSNHHWLRVRLECADGRSPIGALVKLTAGSVTQTRLVSPSRSYLSQMELPVTFGLGAADRVDRLELTWPDGTVQTAPVEGIDREMTLRQPAK